MHALPFARRRTRARRSASRTKGRGWGKSLEAPRASLHELDGHWLRRCTLIAWAVIALFFVWQRWGAIHWLALGDTDDNMRLMQVRGLLAGQGWYRSAQLSARSAGRASTSTGRASSISRSPR